MAWTKGAAIGRGMRTGTPKFDPYKMPHERIAQGIAARSGETGTGSTEGKSPAPQECAQPQFKSGEQQQ